MKNKKGKRKKPASRTQPSAKRFSSTLAFADAHPYAQRVQGWLGPYTAALFGTTRNTGNRADTSSNSESGASL